MVLYNTNVSQTNKQKEKMNKWDIIIGSLFYALPLWLMLIPILIINFDKNGISNDIFALALVSMTAVWGIGFNLMRNNYLEEEIEELKKKLNENK